MTDIIISPGTGSNQTPILQDAFLRHTPGDRLILKNGIYNCEGLTTKNAAIRVPDNITMMAENRGKAEIRRGDNCNAYSILAPSNFDKPNGVNKNQLIAGLRFNGNRTGQSGDWHTELLEHRHCFAVIGLQNTYALGGFEWCDFVELCGDGLILSETWDGSTRTQRTRGIRVADGNFNGKKLNRNGVSFISCEHSNVEGSCTFTECGRDDMPGAVCYEPDTPEDFVFRCDTSGTFKDNIHDVTFIAQWPGTRIQWCGGNIRTNHPIPWESIFVTAIRGGEADHCFMASTPWDK